MTGALAEGWVLTLTDYPGLGTPSPHPYLVGESQGRAVLDSVRAAHELDTGVELDRRVRRLGPLRRAATPPCSPASSPSRTCPSRSSSPSPRSRRRRRLEENFAAIEGTQAGNILTILAIDSWSSYYPEISDDILVESARRPAARIADSCLNQPSGSASWSPASRCPTPSPPARSPTTRLDRTSRRERPGPGRHRGTRVRRPGRHRPGRRRTVTEGWVADRCASGAATHWQTYPGVDHPGSSGREVTTRWPGRPTSSPAIPSPRRVPPPAEQGSPDRLGLTKPGPASSINAAIRSRRRSWR